MAWLPTFIKIFNFYLFKIYFIFLLKEQTGQNKVSGLAIVNYPEKLAPDDKHLQTTIGPW